jgi:hypothetical protein
VVTNYTAPGVVAPSGLTAGPDGALWFTGNNLIGRISTTVTPHISSFTPASGPVGTRLTIVGHHLSGATGVAIGGVSAPIISDKDTQIVTKVHTGAKSGRITVTTAGGTATSVQKFSVT